MGSYIDEPHRTIFHIIYYSQAYLLPHESTVYTTYHRYHRVLLCQNGEGGVEGGGGGVALGGGGGGGDASGVGEGIEGEGEGEGKGEGKGDEEGEGDGEIVPKVSMACDCVDSTWSRL